MTPRRGFGPLLTLIVGVFVISAAIVVVLPTLEDDSRRPSVRACGAHPGECETIERVGDSATLTVEANDPERAAAINASSSKSRGRDVYVAQGCASCHTQNVRPVLADAALGNVSQAGDYAFEDAPLLGDARVGPDLFNVGTRSPFNTCDGVKTYLRDPRALRPWSNSPSYDHLDERELNDLASYIVHLRPANAAGPDTCDPAEQPADATPTTPSDITPTA